MTLPILACAWSESENPYLFSMYSPNSFKGRVEKICDDNWKAYLGLPADDYFWFNADDVITAARQKGDALMVSYVQNLKKYLDCVGVEQQKQYDWNYPTKEEISAQQRDLEAVNTYAFGKLKTKLRSQHALLYMRTNMMLGRHHANITFWEQTASQFIETVYKDMMKNIYAGALYKTGQEQKAGEMFAEMGDYESLMTIYYKKRSYQAIRQHYMQNPNSKVLPFLLQDFVNNTQEAEDAKKEAFGGKLFIRDINQQESWQMQQFCEMVVREGKTEAPIMWKCAKAWLEFMSGKQKEAAKDIIAATKLDGTERMKDNARVLMLYITAAQAKPSNDFDEYLVKELEWFNTKDEEFFHPALNRIARQTLLPHYQDKPEQQLALMASLGLYEYDMNVDTIEVEKVEKYLFYTNTPAKTTLDKYLKSRISKKDSVLIELIGTKYMRLAQWDKAIKWLENIPAAYYNEHRSDEYLYYSRVRSYEVEPWIKRQWLDSSKAYERKQTWYKQIKLDFCKEMQMMESSLNLLKGKALEQRYYNLAVRYAQASIKGDCWWLLHNAKSVWDQVSTNEADFGKKAAEYLQKASMTSDPDLKRKALFGMSYRELYTTTKQGILWHDTYWDEQASDYVDRYAPQSPQFRAFQALYEMVGDAPKDEYIRRCDEFDQFRNYYRAHR